MLNDEEKLTLKEIPWPYNLIEVLSGWAASWYQDEVGFLDFTAKGIISLAHEALTPRELAILETRFGADGKGPKSLSATGELFGINGERCRQIEAKALRKMANPYRLQRYSAIPWKCWNSERQARIAAENREKEANNRLRWVLENCTYQMKPGIEPIEKPEDVGSHMEDESTAIEEMDLSVRSFNCLKRSGINSLGDLLKITSEEDALRIRNLGRRCWEEIQSKVHQLGHKFMWEE